jgi:hypothetical protein
MSGEKYREDSDMDMRISTAGTTADGARVLANWRAGAAVTSEARELTAVSGTFGHKEAGLLRLTATGAGGWVLSVRGDDYGIGPVGRRERQGDELRPSRRTLARAATKALELGPDTPPDSIMFVGGERLTVGEYMVRNKLVGQ